MCGRYVSPAESEIERVWHVGRDSSNPFPRRYNVAPTALIPVLLRNPESDRLALHIARWGLIPHWWKDSKPPRLTFNARAEEASAKPMWRTPLRNTRCLVPAAGWYEWKEIERTDPATGEIVKAKQPYFIHPPDDRLFCFAGVMSHWSKTGEDPQLSCALLTTAAAGLLKEVHERMPVVLPDEAHAAWLDPELNDGADALALAREHALTRFAYHPVSTRVNAATNDDPKLIEASN
ncbi:MAG: SOS response-associated peptidase [Burkholderiales bacterium]